MAGCDLPDASRPHKRDPPAMLPSGLLDMTTYWQGMQAQAPQTRPSAAPDDVALSQAWQVVPADIKDAFGHLFSRLAIRLLRRMATSQGGAEHADRSAADNARASAAPGAGL